MKWKMFLEHNICIFFSTFFFSGCSLSVFCDAAFASCDLVFAFGAIGCSSLLLVDGCCIKTACFSSFDCCLVVTLVVVVHVVD